MPHVVTEACINCRNTDCVEICPVDAFHAGSKMLVIGDECIDCGLCVVECGPKAIYSEEDLPKDQAIFKALNLRWAKKWPTITRKESPLKDSDKWEKRKFKRDQIPELLEPTDDQNNS